MSEEQIKMVERYENLCLRVTMPGWLLAFYISPKRYTLNALLAITGRTDANELLEELRLSGQIQATYCGNVRAFVFYASFGRQAATRPTDDVWTSAKNFYAKYPYPKIKGFFRWPNSGEIPTTLTTPFDPGQSAISQKVYDAMIRYGYKPDFEHPGNTQPEAPPIPPVIEVVPMPVPVPSRLCRDPGCCGNPPVPTVAIPLEDPILY